jgi:hypothetical protein
MPKLTRDDLFRNAMETFLSDITVVSNPNEETKYSIFKYELNGITSNKNKCVQEYELNIPSSIISAYFDRTARTGEGEEEWLDSVPIYCTQDTPLLHDFINSFHEYFDSYRLYIDRTPVSYMSIVGLPRTRDIPLCDKPLCIKVLYHKSHTPFPRPLTPLEEKDREIKFLETKLRRKNNHTTHLRTIIDTKYDRAEHNYKRMQQKFRAIYTESGKLENCPVCYEEISPDKLIIPNCFHYICDVCVMKCDKCPLCRDKYDDYIEYETND